MVEDDEKEFDPSESEEFLKAINEVLDVPEQFEADAIDIKTNNSTANKSQLIDIPDAQEETEETLSDSEFDAYGAALAQDLARIFEEQDNLPKETSDADMDLPEINLDDVIGSEEVTDNKITV